MMRFYNYIFAAGYENQIRNREDFIPWVLPLGNVFSVMALNIFTIFFLLERWIIIEFSHETLITIAAFLFIGLLIYYLRSNRHRQIWQYYHEGLKQKNRVELWLIYFCPAVISSSLFLLAGLYRNHAWIFE